MFPMTNGHGIKIIGIKQGKIMNIIFEGKQRMGKNINKLNEGTEIKLYRCSRTH